MLDCAVLKEPSMLMRYAVIVAACGLLCVHTSQSQDFLYSVSVKGNFTVSSRLFYNVDASDEFLRSQYFALDDVFGVGFDVRRRIEDTWIQIGLSAEYLSKRQSYFSSLARVPVEDGYWSVPVELSGYFIIPFSSSTVRLYIGGGTGLYLGERRYSYAGERASIVSSKAGLGIHVVTGIEYALAEWFALRSEVKFRDLQFESSHVFTKSSVVYQGRTIQLPDQTPRRSRINADGMLIDAGIVIRF